MMQKTELIVLLMHVRTELTIGRNSEALKSVMAMIAAIDPDREIETALRTGKILPKNS